MAAIIAGCGVLSMMSLLLLKGGEVSEGDTSLQSVMTEAKKEQAA